MGLLDSFFEKKINVTTVYNLLCDIQISPNQVKSEKTIEKIIAKELANEFGGNNVHPQYSIPGYFGMKVDIDVGDGNVGIELKLATSLDNSVANVQRLFGQAIYYSSRLYAKNLIVAVIGNAKLEEKPFMQEIEKHLKEIGVEFIYITTGRK